MRKSGKVLVVDDYEANLKGLGQLLQSAHYSVFTATNGREALDLVKRERFDLVLLDVLMPGLSGVDVCRGRPRPA
jgi:two-component system cell cycle response regulator